jgi:hypothetical protein
MNLYARVTQDGYMLYAASDQDYTGSDRYWPDYYSDEFPDGEVETLFLADVPADLAASLCEQGGSGQEFSDGYEAWQAALPYAGDCQPC